MSRRWLLLLQAYNRTMMELKCDTEKYNAAAAAAYNRTMMELKFLKN